MHHLVGSTPTLLMAALLLVVVASLPALPALAGRVARLRVLVCLAAILAGASGLWTLVRYGRVLPEYPYNFVKYAATELQHVQAPNVVVIEGASYTLSAVDTELLEAELSRLGYGVSAVRIASAGANHFERHQMQRCTLDRLQGKPDPNQRWLLLAEIQAGYDTQPLAQFAHNQDTPRTYHYATLENGWYAMQALGGPGVEEPKEEWRWLLFRHALINSFNAGVLLRLAPEDAIEPSTGAVDGRLPIGKFKFGGLSRVLEGAQHPVPKASLPSWLFDVREPRLRRLWRGHLDELVYFGVPSTAPEQMSYISGFCSATGAKCIAPDAELLGALDDKAYWRNAGHVTFQGAKIYSSWLARALARSGALKK